MGGVQTKRGWLLVQGNLSRGGMAETAMAETTSADFIVGLIMGNVVKKPARATSATEGGGDAGAEAKGQAAAEGSEARVFFASGGIGVLPAEVGITLGSCSLSKGAAEDDGVEVEQAIGCTCKGGKLLKRWP